MCKDVQTCKFVVRTRASLDIGTIVRQLDTGSPHQLRTRSCSRYVARGRTSTLERRSCRKSRFAGVKTLRQRCRLLQQFLCINAIAAFWAPLAAAGEAAHESDREAIISEAVSEFAQKHYEESLTLFERAHRLRPTARTARALAKCYFEIRQYVTAVEYADLALASEVDALGEELRKEVQELRVRALGFTATVQVRVQTRTTEDLRVLVDGQPVAVGAGPIRVNAGTHSFGVRSGDARENRTLHARGGEALIAEFDLRAPSGGSSAASATLSPSWLVVSSAALLSTGVSVGYFIDRSRALTRCERAAAVGAACENVDPIEVERGIALGWIGASVVTTVIGVTGLVVSARRPSPPRVSCFVNPQSMQCTWITRW
jgi:hypothetical protein